MNPDGYWAECAHAHFSKLRKTPHRPYELSQPERRQNLIHGLDATFIAVLFPPVSTPDFKIATLRRHGRFQTDKTKAKPKPDTHRYRYTSRNALQSLYSHKRSSSSVAPNRLLCLLLPKPIYPSSRPKMYSSETLLSRSFRSLPIECFLSAPLNNVVPTLT